MRFTLRRTAAALIVLPAVLGVAACGKTETPTTGTTQSAASSSTTSATTGQVYKDKASFIAALKAGAKDATTAHVDMNVDAAGEKVKMVGDSKVDPTNPAMKISMDMGSMKLDMILVDGKIYMKGFPGLPAGKWASIDSSSATGKQLTEALKQADPSQMYDQFDKAVTDVKYIGEDTVDGEKTNKYELTLDTKSIADSLPTDGSQQLPATITYTVWLDGKDHLRKVVFDAMGAKADMTMSKYGEPVDIQAPAASDTVKAPM